MMNITVQRIKREIMEIVQCEQESNCGVRVELVNDSCTDLRGVIVGPADTPYEGGSFTLEIKIPEAYPFKPPKVKFITKIWHPNISSTSGFICLDILGDHWSAAMSLHTLLLSIQSLLAAAEPNDPLEGVVARQYRDQPEVFRRTATHWSQVYAGVPGNFPEFDTKIKSLLDKGMNEDQARWVLSSCSWNLERATEFLIRN